MKYHCCTERRRTQVRQHGTLNGVDFLEVSGDMLAPTLQLNFLKAVPAVSADDVSFSITGGERIPSVTVTGFVQVTPTRWDLSVNAPGDFSIYTLRLELADAAGVRLAPLLDQVDFSFKIDCESDFDCLEETTRAPEPMPRPAINYLARDYASFRQLMLDRLGLLMPEWQERNAADLNMAMVEILAYVGDYLSYGQDAVATEAYLGTARRRVSVRRHARLVDYYIHDGGNAQVWVQVQVSANNVLLPAGTPLFTRVNDNTSSYAPNSRALEEALRQNPLIFETAADAHLFSGHNTMDIYTWGDEDCCLSAGATTASLAGDYPFLKAGDVLVFVEVRGPETGSPADADPNKRHAVRLTHVSRGQDPLGGRFLEAPTDDPVPVTEICWDSADALPFAVCVTHQGQVTSRALGNMVEADHGAARVEVLKEIVPAPHLWRVAAGHDARCDESVPEPVPARYRPRLQAGPLTCSATTTPKALFHLPFTAGLATALDGGSLPPALQSSLNQASRDLQDATLSVQGIAPAWSVSDDETALLIRRETDASAGTDRVYVYDPAAIAAGPDATEYPPMPVVSLAAVHLPDDPDQARAARTQIGDLVQQLDDTQQARTALLEALVEQFDAATWTPRRDLLNSGKSSRDFVVEIESDGAAYLRFGDDVFGERPAENTLFVAFYRVGNGRLGNVGRNTLAHIVTSDSSIESVDNPLPARGGAEPESIKEVRQRAPTAFRRQERAVTAEDYATWATRHPEVQRAAATLRWTGSWHTVFLTIDRVGGKPVDASFKGKIRRYLERYRMAGHDLEVDSPSQVSLEIDLNVCVRPDHFQSEVRQALLQRFTSGYLPDGSRGVFHPDNFTFGQPVYLSQLVAEAARIEGVESVEVSKFQRQGQDDYTALNLGRLDIGRLEIARLENNPNFPERGVLRLTMLGGK